VTIFEQAFDYVIAQEGLYSNDPHDRGGVTWYGITNAASSSHRCPLHPDGIPITAFSSANARDLAKHIYRSDFWRFDGIRDARIAIKAFDICVNVGLRTGIRILQRAIGVKDDGAFGELSAAALARLPSEEVLERLSERLIDHYIDIVTSNRTQMKFLRGWCRRAVRRPRIEVRPGVEKETAILTKLKK
jgi:lysozyme family protein